MTTRTATASKGTVDDLRIVRGTLVSRVFALVALGVVVALATLPSWGAASTQKKLIELFVLLALAQMWNLLAGFAGIVSVGQQAFVGFGAYGMIVFVNNLHLDLYLSVLLSAIGAAALSVPLGLVAFRLRGSYFAIGTWVLATLASLVMTSINQVGGGSGASIKVTGTKALTRLHNTYWIALVVGIGAVLIAYGLLRSRLGLQMQAIRDNESGARSLGADVYRTRFLIWVVAAFWTGLAGATFYFNNLRVQPTAAFSVVSWTAPIIFIVVIGGMGTIEGPIIGAVAYYVLKDRFSEAQTTYFIALGVVAIAAALFLKRGVWGAIRGRSGLSLFPVRRRVVGLQEPEAR
jgi:branched-chain amino acid transport system permease protein